jgi:hypothetical protein
MTLRLETCVEEEEVVDIVAVLWKVGKRESVEVGEEEVVPSGWGNRGSRETSVERVSGCACGV